jgi:hypothetical protein
MAYDGDPTFVCRPYAYDFVRAHAVVVSGAKLNPCGHMLLNAGGTGGWYFHIAEWIGRPRCMNERGYRRYLEEHGKREVRRTWVPLRDVSRAQAKLEELLAGMPERRSAASPRKRMRDAPRPAVVHTGLAWRSRWNRRCP